MNMKEEISTFDFDFANFSETYDESTVPLISRRQKRRWIKDQANRLYFFKEYAGVRYMSDAVISRVRSLETTDLRMENAFWGGAITQAGYILMDTRLEVGSPLWEFVLYHEEGHILNGDAHTTTWRAFLDLIHRSYYTWAVGVLPKEMAADDYAVTKVGKEAAICALEELHGLLEEIHAELGMSPRWSGALLEIRLRIKRLRDR